MTAYGYGCGDSRGLVIRMKFQSGTGKRVVISEGEGGISRWY